MCFDIQNWIGNGHLLPSGPLREKLNSLKKYDIVFLKGNSENSDIKEIIRSIQNQNSKWIRSSKIFCGFTSDIEKKTMLYSNIRGWKNLKIVTNQYINFSIAGKKIQQINTNAKSVLKAHFLDLSSKTTKVLYHLKHYAKKNPL